MLNDSFIGACLWDVKRQSGAERTWRAMWVRVLCVKPSWFSIMQTSQLSYLARRRDMVGESRQSGDQSKVEYDDVWQSMLLRLRTCGWATIGSVFHNIYAAANARVLIRRWSVEVLKYLSHKIYAVSYPGIESWHPLWCWILNVESRKQTTNGRGESCWSQPKDVR